MHITHPIDYTLDVNAIGMRSIDKRKVILPYNGDLPDAIHCSMEFQPYIQMTVRLAQGARIALVTYKDHKEIRTRLKMSNEEIVDILDRFFAQGDRATGLVSYWLGRWAAYYSEWRHIAINPTEILNIISSVSESEIGFVVEMINKKYITVR